MYSVAVSTWVFDKILPPGRITTELPESWVRAPVRPLLFWGDFPNNFGFLAVVVVVAVVVVFVVVKWGREGVMGDVDVIRGFSLK